MTPRPTLSNTVVLPTSKDKIFITCAILAGVAGMGFSLNSVGYLLGFNSTTLSVFGLVFTVFSLNWITRAKPMETQFNYMLLAVVPIVTRLIFNMALFQEIVASMTAATTPLDQLRYISQVMGIWLLVAVCEEAFRATILNFGIAWIPPTVGIKGWEIELKTDPTAEEWEDLTGTGKAVALVTSTIAWILFHFLQRPLDLQLYGPYIVWLFIAGVTMGYAMVKAGMGAATVIHIITNLTA